MFSSLRVIFAYKMARILCLKINSKTDANMVFDSTMGIERDQEEQLPDSGRPFSSNCPFPGNTILDMSVKSLTDPPTLP